MFVAERFISSLIKNMIGIQFRQTVDHVFTRLQIPKDRSSSAFLI